MERHRATTYATVGTILLVAVATGPLVGAIDLTRESRETGAFPGEGTVDVTVESLPGRATLDRGAYGAAAYVLRVPDARVRLSNVTGRPMVVYRLDLPGLNYSRGTVHFVTSDRAGPFALELERDSLSPESIRRDRYEGTLTVLVRADGERIVARKPITVSVRG